MYTVAQGIKDHFKALQKEVNRRALHFHIDAEDLRSAFNYKMAKINAGNSFNSNEKDFLNYFNTCLTRVAIELYREKVKRPEILELDPLIHIVKTYQDIAKSDMDLLIKSMPAYIHRFGGKLIKKRLVFVFEQHFINGLTLPEIKKEFKLSYTVTKRDVYLIRCILKEKLRNRYLDLIN